jgi:3-methyladenine DNA glycosylase AlkD
LPARADLLNDTTPIVYDRMPSGREWRICDRVADTIAGLPGWQQRLHVFASDEERDAFVARVKQLMP